MPTAAINSIITFLFAIAILFTAVSAEAAQLTYSCFDTEEQAAQFVENLKQQEAAFIDYETKTRELIQTPDIGFNAISFIFSGKLKFIEIGAKTAEETGYHTRVTHQFYQSHLSPMQIEMNTKGQYCSRVGSESRAYEYVWFLDAEKNILDTKISITRTW